MEWRGPSRSPRSTKVRSEKSRIKTMLIVFFDCEGIIHKEFLPEGSTLNAAAYVEVLKRLLQRIRRVRPQYSEPEATWFLLHDNARPHTAAVVQQLLAKRGVASLAHPPYSPDLSPPDYFLIPRLKICLKGKRFSDIDDIQRNVKIELKKIPQEDFARCFNDLYACSKKCVNLKGDYFEGL